MKGARATRGTAALAAVFAVCTWCFCFCCAQATPTLQQQQFLALLWNQRFHLVGNQTLPKTQFEGALADLRIGGYYNATVGCSVAPVGGANETGGSSADACLSSDNLAGTFGFNLSMGLTQENFSSLAVALVQQQLSGKCVRAAELSGNATSEVRDAKWAYIYGTVAVTVISLFSCVGCLLTTCHRMACYQHLMLFLVELAIGSLVGEALLHLLPEVIQNGHEHEEASGVVPPSFYKLVVVSCAIIVLHAVDTGSTVGGLENHSHDTAPQSNLLSLEASGKSYSVSTVETEVTQEETPAAAPEAVKKKTPTPDHHGETSFSFVHGRVRLFELLRHPKLCLRNPVRLCLFVMLGDALHNFADGVAIGAAFALSDKDGLRLSLTIGLHELAHELADFAVLLSCGFSVPAAIFINLICTLTCFGGLYIAIPLSEASTEMQAWILAVTAGMFLYIGLVTMTNLVRRSYRVKSTAAFLVGNLGLIVGFLSVIAISLYEVYG